MIDTGAGAAALGNPARCVAWLANKLGSLGAGLKAGDIVLPGAVHKMVPVEPGDVFRAEFAHLGAVTVRFSKADRTRMTVAITAAGDRRHPDRRRSASARASPSSATTTPTSTGRDGLRGAEGCSCSPSSTPASAFVG